LIHLDGKNGIHQSTYFVLEHICPIKILTSSHVSYHIRVWL